MADKISEMQGFKLVGEKKEKQKVLLNEMNKNYKNKSPGWKEKNQLISKKIEMLYKKDNL